MNRNITITFLSAFLFFTQLNGQEISYGFKAGLNFNSIIGESEKGSNGSDLETYTGNTGFHVGGMFNFGFTDLVGVRAEFLFSQKGGRYKYEGESYYTFQPEEGSELFSTGIRKTNLNITNSYISIPFSVYYRPVKSIEISGGIGVNVLVATTAFGDFKYSGTVGGGSPTDFEYSLEYNYYGDNPGEAGSSSNPQIVQISGRDVAVPVDAGAYFEHKTDRGGLHKPIDFTAVGSIHLFLSQGLFLGFRVDYGLSDFTKTEADISQKSLDGNNFKTLDLKDQHLSLQASVGFSF